jgi:hypothetical protein
LTVNTLVAVTIAADPVMTDRPSRDGRESAAPIGSFADEPSLHLELA